MSDQAPWKYDDDISKEALKEIIDGCFIVVYIYLAIVVIVVAASMFMTGDSQMFALALAGMFAIATGRVVSDLQNYVKRKK